MTLLTKMAPLVWTQPAAGSATAFREDEFVSLWCDMYAMLLRLNFWKREDVILPQKDTGRHAQLHTQRLLSEKGMSPEAVSLLERLPYPRNASYRRMRIYREASTMNYLEEDDVNGCRDPHDMAQYSAHPDSLNDASYLLPQDVALARPDESDGLAWILDLSHSMYLIFLSPKSRSFVTIDTTFRRHLNIKLTWISIKTPLGSSLRLSKLQPGEFRVALPRTTRLNDRRIRITTETGPCTMRRPS